MSKTVGLCTLVKNVLMDLDGSGKLGVLRAINNAAGIVTKPNNFGS